MKIEVRVGLEVRVKVGFRDYVNIIIGVRIRLEFGRGLGSRSGQTTRISDINASAYHEGQSEVESWRYKENLVAVVQRRRGA